MVGTHCEELNKWKQTGHAVQVIRLDNAGENKLYNSTVKLLIGNLALNLSSRHVKLLNRILWQKLELLLCIYFG